MTTPKARTRNVDGRRHYVVHLGGHEHLVPSASTLVSQLDKPAIAGWMVNRHLDAAFNGRRDLRTITDPMVYRRAVRGAVTALGNPEAESGDRAHEAIEAYLLNEKIPDTDEAPWAVRQAKEIEAEFGFGPLELSPTRNGVELTVVRFEGDVPIWAGTSDCIAGWWIDGEYVEGAVDWKSGASGLWPDSILSTSVYSGATHWLDDDGEAIEFERPLTCGGLAWVRPEGYAFVHLDEVMTADAVEVCRSLAIVQNWRRHNPSVPEPSNADPIRRKKR